MRVIERDITRNCPRKDLDWAVTLFYCGLNGRFRKYAFANRVIDNWNLLPANCINYSTINTFKKHCRLSELESEAVKFMKWISCDSRHYPMLTHARIVFGGMLVLLASVNSVIPDVKFHSQYVEKSCMQRLSILFLRRRRRRSEMTSAGQSLYARILYSKIQLLILILISNNNSDFRFHEFLL